MLKNNKNRFADRVAVVTGASAGIGLATAHAFVAEGAKVVMAARNTERLRQAAAEFNADARDRVLARPCDVRNRTDVEGLLAEAAAHFGGIDIVVNNAATGLTAPFEAVQPQDASSLFETNFFGTLNCCQAALPYLKKRGKGHIVNVSSVAGLRGIPNTSIYSASKAAMIALSDALRIEIKDKGIGVTVVCPGRVRLSDTAFFKTAKRYGPVELYKVPSLLTAEEVACALVNAVAKNKAMIVLPFHAYLFYRINCFFPRLVDYLLYKKMPRLTVTTPAPPSTS